MNEMQSMNWMKNVCSEKDWIRQMKKKSEKQKAGWSVNIRRKIQKSKLTERRDTKCDSKEVYVIKERGGEEVPSCKSNTYDEKAEMFQKIKRISIRNRCCIRIHYHNRC